MQSTFTHPRTLGRASFLVLFAGLALAACSGNDNNNNNTTTNNNTQMDMSTATDDGGDTTDAGADDGGDEPDDGGDEPDDGGGEPDMPADMPDTDEFARVQVLHLADGAGVVDVYANGTLLIDNIDEKQGTGFFDVPAGVDLTLDVVGGDAADNSAPVYTVTLTGGLAANANYIVAATGDVASEDDATKFRLVPIAGAQVADEPSTDPVSAMIIHGVDDATTVDVVIEPGLPGELAIDNLDFAGFTGDGTTANYVSLSADDVTFGGIALANINVASSDAYVAGFQTPDVSTLVGQKVVIAATGSVEEGTFGLTAFLGLPGSTTPSPGIQLSSAARIQAVHNSPDPAAQVVDVYGNGVKLIDDFEFRTATPYITVPAGAEIDFNIGAPDSTDDADPVFDGPAVTFDPGSTTLLVASGVVGAQGDAAFSILDSDGQETLETDEIAVKIHHGSPDTIPVGVRAEGADTNIIDSFDYGTFSDFLLLPPNTNVVLEIINPAEDDAPVVKTNAAIDFSGFTTPVVVMASGSSGLIPDIFTPGGLVSPIALLAVLPDGSEIVIPLVPAND